MITVVVIPNNPTVTYILVTPTARTYLDLSIHRNNDLYLGIHRKPTQTDTNLQ